MKEDAILKSFEGSIPFSEANKLSGALLAEKIVDGTTQNETNVVLDAVDISDGNTMPEGAV